MTFIDSSVVIAVLAKEEDADDWLSRIGASTERTTSPLVILETTMRLSTILKVDAKQVEVSVRAFLQETEIDVIDIVDEDAALAIDAFARFGKGRGHPAQLNLADCLSYACAKRLGAKLLYKGNDFAQTDMA